VGTAKTMKVLLRQDCFGRWIVIHPVNQDMAWSGSRWVEIDEANGLPVGDVQVSNCPTRDAAVLYCEEFEFEVMIE
jgi:hypothetical protein